MRKLLVSPRTALALMGAIAAACCAASFVPQIADSSPAVIGAWRSASPLTYRLAGVLRLDRIYTSPWFLLLVAAAGVVLAYSVRLQFRGCLSGLAGSGAPAVQFPGQGRLSAALSARGYSMLPASAGEARFAANRPGRWGSPVFHLGLLLVIVAAFLTFAFQQRGFVQLIEGEVFDGAAADFLTVNNGPLAGRFLVPFSLRMNKLEQAYWGNGQPRDFGSRVDFLEESGRPAPALISVNNPFRRRGVTVYQSPYYGYSVSLALKRPAGAETLTHFLLDRAAVPSRPAVGGADFPGTGYLFWLEFLPDAAGRSFFVKDPVLKARVTEGGRVVFDGPVPMDGTVRVGADSLRVAAVRGWSGLVFVRDRWQGLAYAGLGLCVLGAALMFLLPYRELAVALPDAGEAVVRAVSGREMDLLREEARDIEAELKKWKE
ncbi:MAG: cytochrome c biogenesis protein ResB [Elusimicrobia bacterium]|nr:cytochrome c biogenesis protein ResB [Elusimicrobiota bacterium]